MTTDPAPATVRAVPAAGDELDGRYGADAGRSARRLRYRLYRAGCHSYKINYGHAVHSGSARVGCVEGRY